MISAPEFQAKRGNYLFSWKELQLQAELSRIHQNHDGVKCKITFTSTHPEAESHIFEDNFNLDSSRSRAGIEKEMLRRYKIKEIKEGIDWKNLLEYVSKKALKEFEKGEPVLELTSEADRKPLEYFIDPIAPKGKPTVLFGLPGAGKSQMAVIFNIVACLPWHDNPLHLKAPSAPMKCLFLDYEADPEDVERQLGDFSRGMDLTYVRFFYRRCSLPLSDDLEAVMNHVEAVGASCLFVDSVSLAAGGDVNKTDFATSYFRALRQTQLTSISLAHTNKDQESKSKTILGTILFEAGARSVWEVQGQPEDSSLDVALHHRKGNLSGRSKPLGYRITYQGDRAVIAWHDPKSVPEFLERMSVNQQILELLKRGKLSSQQLTTDLKAKRNTVDQAVKRLSDASKISGDHNGWGLVYQGEVDS